MAIITRTLKVSGGDYTSFGGWEAGEQTDLVTDGDSHVLECFIGDGTVSGGWQADGTLNDRLVLSGWTTGSSNFITIKAGAGEEHQGVIGDGFLVYDNNSAGTFEFSPTVEHTVIQDITVKAVGNVQALRGLSGTTVERCIIEGRDYTGSAGSATAENNSLHRNCLIISGGRAINARGGINTIENCTIVGVGSPTYGVLTDGDVVLKNTVVVDFATEDVFGSPGTNTTNATLDGSITGATVVLTDGTDFVSPSTEDYSPASGGNLDDAGTDLSADFTDDITGATRTQWDIGAYSVAAGGGTDVDVTPGSASFTLTPQNPTVDVVVDVDVSVTSASFTLTPNNPTVSVAEDVDVEVNTTAFTLTPVNPTVTVDIDVDVTPGVTTYTLTPYNPTVSLDNDVVVDVTLTTFTLTTYQTNITADVEVAPSVASFALTPYTATITVGEVTTLQYFDGAVWVTGVLKRYTGSEWTETNVIKKYSGTAWVNL